MKGSLSLCALLLGGSMMVVAQQPAAPNTNSTPSTPPTFPTDQQQKAPLPDRPQDQLPPDTSAPASPDASSQSSQTSSQSSSASAATNKSIEGCLSQASSAGGFTLTDASGMQYALVGDSSQLSSHIGEQVRVQGDVTQVSASNAPASASNTDNPDAKNSDSASTPASAGSMANQGSISVSKIDKVASSCSSAANPSSK